MGWEEDISNKERQVVEELKKRTINDMTPHLLGDKSVFYRFCKARDFNLEKAEDLLRKHIVWRKENDVDNILTNYEPPEVMQKYLPVILIGYDKEGCPVIYGDMGNTDMKGIFHSMKKKDVFKTMIHNNELIDKICREQSEKLGKEVSQGVHICNNENLSFRQLSDKRVIEMNLAFAKVFQDNYPERIKRLVYINAPSFFTMAFNLLKSVLATALLQKIRIYGSDGWKKELLEMINPDDLPAFLGGNKTDPDGDPNCKTFVKFGEKVPESYYLKKGDKTLSKMEGVSKVTVSRSSKEKVTIEVEKEGSYIQWEMETQSRDIAFGIRFQDRSSKEVLEVYPVERMETDYGPEKGLFKCEKPGTYIIVFDNSYSWMYSKEIYYRVSIRSAEDVEGQKIS